MKFENRVAVVTGGAGRIGRALAENLCEQNVAVALADISAEQAESVAERLRAKGGTVRVYAMDVEHTESVRSAAGQILADFGRADILVNNAGVAVKVEPLLSFSDEEIFRSINGNLTGAILGCRRVAEKMVARKSGLIINVTSVCSHYGWPGFACYTAAKAGLDMFSRALYTELRPHNVRVTVLTPSWGATEFGIAATLPPTEKELAAKMMSPDQMGELVRYICDFPEHLEFPEIMVQPLVQEIIPF